MQKGNQRPITALNMAPMELDCDVDSRYVEVCNPFTIYYNKYNK